MAEKKQDGTQSGVKFTLVEETYEVQGGALRDVPTVTVYRSGASRANREAVALIEEMLRAAGVDPMTAMLLFGANEEQGLVALYGADMKAKGAMALRRSGPSMHFHMGSVFKKHEALRPPGTRWCPVTFEADAEGKPCVTIAITKGVAKRTKKNGGANNDTPASGDPSSAAS